MPVLETERLILRPYGARDAHRIFALASDPRVFFWLDEPATLADCEAMLAEKLPLYRERGQGFWGIFRRDDGAFIGQVFLQPLADTDNVEIGWHVLPEFHNRGYATEAARRLLDYGLTDLGLGRITAIVLPGNSPSLAVTGKLGLTYMKDFVKRDRLHHLFSLTRAAHAAPAHRARRA
jgi:RimJ/RimL family protein N-acetyltransferase